MKEERTIKQLLQLMLEHQELFVGEIGLCHWNFTLYTESLITFKERCLLKDFIDNNRPSKYSSMDAFNDRYRMFYWKSGDIKPRIKWIKKHISRL